MTDAAVCARHPETPAIGNCARCGTFVCAADSTLAHGALHCGSCAARPDVNYLEGFRLRYWGKRDGWAWVFGAFAPLQVLTGLLQLVEGDQPLVALFMIAAGIAAGLWWAGFPLARVAVPLISLCFCAVSAVTVGAGVLMPLGLGFLILMSVVMSTRTQLFFKLDVSRDQLRRMWDLYANNSVARYAQSIGVLGLLIPPLGPLALVLGLIGLNRVDPNATPPIGRRGAAIAGIVMGTLGSAAVIIGLLYLALERSR